MNNEDIWHTLDIIISDMHTLVYNLNKIQLEISRRWREEDEGALDGDEK